MILSNIIKYIITNKYVLSATIIIVSVLSFYAYYEYSSNKIEMLSIKTRQLQDDLHIKESVIESLKYNYSKILKSKDELISLNEKNNKTIIDLKNKLNREQFNKKSLEDLAKSKPKLVENYINKEIMRQLDCLKNITSGGDC